MNDRQKAQFAACLLIVAPLAAWILTARFYFDFTPENVRSRLGYLVTHTFQLWPLWAALAGGLLVGIAGAVLVYMLARETFKGATFDKFYRGTRLATARALARDTVERGETQITLAGVPVPTKAESTHFSVGGATGTGKSTIFKEMMFSAMKRGDRMVILDPDGEFLSCFWRKGDKILNPFDDRTEGWSFFNEIREDFDFERYARSIIQPSNSADSEEWYDYGRLLFHEVARKLYNSDRRNATIAQVFDWTNKKPAEELEAFVEGTNAQSLFTGNDRASNSVRFVLSNKLAPHLKMPAGPFSLREWLADPKGGNLFITWNENMRAALRPLIATWVDSIFTSILGMPPDPKRRIWAFLDELESLERLPTLGDALTKGRKKGLCVVSGYQSYAQLEYVYGDKLAETMLANHRTAVVLAVGRGGERTVERMSKAMGQHEVRRYRESHNQPWDRMGSRSRNEETKPERVVLPSEIMALPDLEGYLAFPGSLPVAKFKLEITDYKRSVPVVGIQPPSRVMAEAAP